METQGKVNLAKAIIEVMKEVEGIEKNSNIGTGTNAYKGVSDQDVKKTIGASMAKHGLCILPLETNAKVRVDRWEESYNGGQPKPKQAIFTEVEPKYLLLHTSGESQVVSGYGHGVDSQDKSAGKATTYALKNLLLYMFLVPTGKLEDTDNKHSDDMEVPKTKNFDYSDKERNKIIEEAQRFTVESDLVDWANKQVDWLKDKIFVTEVQKLIAKFKK